MPPPKQSPSPGPQPRLTQDPREFEGRFTVVECPSPALALSNCLTVHPSNPLAGVHVIINGRFPLTTKFVRHEKAFMQTFDVHTQRQDNTGKLLPSQVGPSAIQRKWMGLSSTGGQVTVAPLDVPLAEIQMESLDLEVGFWRRGLEIEDEFSALQMAESFIDAFNDQIFAMGQQLVFEYHGWNLKAIAVGLKVVELAESQLSKPSAATGMGVLMKTTQVTFTKAADSLIKIKDNTTKVPVNAILRPDFRFADMGIGGLDNEFSHIFRRAFASRVFPLALVKKLGIKHVKGILLYGPPGTGKTLMARQIGKMLNGREPKVVNGPEILNKFVGESEGNIRNLFVDAEKEYKDKGDESGLHIIIFDELDAICKPRGSGVGAGSGVGDSVVNQLLSKMDGVNQLNNILVIGMTNRLDMIDEALLRPGRMEVRVEISLPDQDGRLQILKIHTSEMRTNDAMEDKVDLVELSTMTKNFSGAEIEGLVKSATSFALGRHVEVGTTPGISDDNNIRVNRDDFMQALKEVHSAYGVSEGELQLILQNDIIHFDNIVDALLREGSLYVEQVRSSIRTPLVSVLLYGPRGCGKTALAAKIARASEFPFIKLVTPDGMVGLNEAQRVAAINKAFADSYKSPLSVIVIDNIERLLGWVRTGPRFSDAVLQTLLVLLQRRPPKDRRLLIICTTSIREKLTELEMSEVFDAELHVPPISTLRALEIVLEKVHLFSNSEELGRAMEMLEQASGKGGLQIGIKKLLSIIETARQEPDQVAQRLVRALVELGKLPPS